MSHVRKGFLEQFREWPTILPVEAYNVPVEGELHPFMNGYIMIHYVNWEDFKNVTLFDIVRLAINEGHDHTVRSLLGRSERLRKVIEAYVARLPDERVLENEQEAINEREPNWLTWKKRQTLTEQDKTDILYHARKNVRDNLITSLQTEIAGIFGDEVKKADFIANNPHFKILAARYEINLLLNQYASSATFDSNKKNNILNLKMNQEMKSDSAICLSKDTGLDFLLSKEAESFKEELSYFKHGWDQIKDNALHQPRSFLSKLGRFLLDLFVIGWVKKLITGVWFSSPEISVSYQIARTIDNELISLGIVSRVPPNVTSTTVTAVGLNGSGAAGVLQEQIKQAPKDTRYAQYSDFLHSDDQEHQAGSSLDAHVMTDHSASESKQSERSLSPGL